ncbi:hypothetical protein GCM10011505_07490 [Tistrella bauzanensis]|uniref:Uncharacterized protein n=1 Tax=Tistrella bauzanensis TaxID=657419 RepID=A0ABQ1I8Z1_9PROT|nr:hypothetical protein GCM10011505_07490 [Tistrella bauzanensis]
MAIAMLRGMATARPSQGIETQARKAAVPAKAAIIHETRPAIGRFRRQRTIETIDEITQVMMIMNPTVLMSMRSGQESIWLQPISGTEGG